VEIALRDRGPEWYRQYDVQITGVPAVNRLLVLKVLREKRRLPLSAVKGAIEALPLTVAWSEYEETAREIAAGYEAAGAQVMLSPAGAVRNEGFGPLQKDRLLAAGEPTFSGDSEGEWQEVPVRGPVGGPNAEFQLSLQSCSSCGTIGHFASESQEGMTTCPHCKRNRLVLVGGWIT
jgi:hypothetical protein